ncbi:hypothetical protein [Sphingomonas sp. CFBP 8760]|uniref:hypothetical protein n=1 Tax=Sphingomonas sp. CFBP 8760 TaxID=2775282 RepID=UPI001A927E9E|nr:hypothetical protein [Sphingomonas sp. CFBP 8760]
MGRLPLVEATPNGVPARLLMAVIDHSMPALAVMQNAKVLHHPSATIVNYVLTPARQ